MNKQEAIEKINNIDTLNINDMMTCQQVDMVIKNQVLDIINQIDEPQKVVIPKFVAEWIEKCKDKNYSLRDAMRNIKLSVELNAWFLKSGQDMFTYPNQELFARAWLDGYEVEQEKLYTVEIPDPNCPDTVTFLYKENGKVFIGSNIFLNEAPNYEWKKDPENQLTESEIKKDFDWAWQFAKEVE